MLEFRGRSQYGLRLRQKNVEELRTLTFPTPSESKPKRTSELAEVLHRPKLGAFF